MLRVIMLSITAILGIFLGSQPIIQKFGEPSSHEEWMKRISILDMNDKNLTKSALRRSIERCDAEASAFLLDNGSGMDEIELLSILMAMDGKGGGKGLECTLSQQKEIVLALAEHAKPIGNMPLPEALYYILQGYMNAYDWTGEEIAKVVRAFKGKIFSSLRPEDNSNAIPPPFERVRNNATSAEEILAHLSWEKFDGDVLGAVGYNDPLIIELVRRSQDDRWPTTACKEIVDTYLRRGGDPNVKTQSNEPLLQILVEIGNLESVRLLAESPKLSQQTVRHVSSAKIVKPLSVSQGDWEQIESLFPDNN